MRSCCGLREKIADPLISAKKRFASPFPSRTRFLPAGVFSESERRKYSEGTNQQSGRTGGCRLIARTALIQNHLQLSAGRRFPLHYRRLSRGQFLCLCSPALPPNVQAFQEEAYPVGVDFAGASIREPYSPGQKGS